MRTFDLETTGLSFEGVLAVEVATFSSHRRRDSSGTGRLEGRCNGKLGAFKIACRRMLFIVKQGDGGTTVTEIFRKAGIELVLQANFDTNFSQVFRDALPRDPKLSLFSFPDRSLLTFSLCFMTIISASVNEVA